jgi:NADPH:quinone reductase-like Zn-dependent oxidoreductase
VKAAVYYETGSPEVFRYEDVPDPSVPGGQLELPGVPGAVRVDR